jgi:hypothetical protein
MSCALESVMGIVRRVDDPRLMHPACIYRGLNIGLTPCPG